MMTHLPRRTAVLLALLPALALGACGDRERARDADTGMGGTPTPTDTAMAGAADTAAGATTGWSDANIVALLDEANKADSAAGAVAAKKATNPEVRSFAKLMMSEHHALRVEGNRLAKKLNITPALPANDPVTPMAKDEMNALQSAPKGAEFDRTYIDQEVTAHEAVKDLADKAHAATQNQELKRLIEKASPVIQKHLDQAKKLQSQLGKTA